MSQLCDDIRSRPVSWTCSYSAIQVEVEVDQRGLVNILSRYPGPFDVLRELIQNADDAEAHSIEIHFQSKEVEKSQPTDKLDIDNFKVNRWIIKNDGKLFEPGDWDRLGKIAHGNSNSTKVGAFGVGFYSVLSKSDRPLVKSNGKVLQFHRGEDGKLRKSLGKCPQGPQTAVELELREPAPLPVLVDLTRFLVSSVAFLTNIDTISVYLDRPRVLRIQRSFPVPAVDIPIPQHLKPKTPSQALTVESIQRTVQRLAVDAADCVFASGLSRTSMSIAGDADDTLIERRGRSEEAHPKRTFRGAKAMLEDNAITHDLYTATTWVDLSEHPEMREGVESNLKSLPSSFKCKAVYFNSEQCLAGISNSQSPETKQLAALFCGSQGIFPENDSGRLFISQSTNQTTGIGLHISAHFLPTMERGAIDLANGQVKAWNKEVLWIAGFLARMIYEKEMHTATTKSKDDVTHLGLCTMARFAFGPTVPHSGVSQILRNAFFSCSHEEKSPFPVVSNNGIWCASDAQFRQRNNDLTFLKKYRVLHDEIELPQRSEITFRFRIPMFKFGDIVREFASGVTQDAMRSFFSWWEDARRSASSTPSAINARDRFCKEFANRGVLVPSQGSKIMFSNIRHFTFFPLPNDLSHPNSIYIDVSAGVPTRNSVECFGWTQLPLLDWLEYACSRASQLGLRGDSGRDSDVGYRILRVLLQFALVEDLSLQQWARAAEFMKSLNCVPTNMGLHLPANSYFDEAVVCRTLPVVEEADFVDIPPTPVATMRGFELKFVDLRHVRTLLARIRIRRVVDWDDMVGRLETVVSEESNYRLLHYLIIHRRELTDRHINDLKEKRIFYSRNHGQFLASQLYFPNDDLDKLGFPILELPRDGLTSLRGIVESSGLFALESFIEFLGIQMCPTLGKIITLAASDEPEVQRYALQYLLSNLGTHYDVSQLDHFGDVAFVPTKNGSLACRREAFTSAIWEKLGFEQVPDALRHELSRLGVKDDPSIDTIIEYLKTPERTLPDLNTAAIWFEHLYLYGKLSAQDLRERLSIIPFVPMKNLHPSSSDSSPLKYICPKDCFITSAETKQQHRDIFSFIDFGRNGNSFLECCCAKKSPDASDIVRKIAHNSQNYLHALGDNTNLYLDDLRTVASQLDLVSEDDKHVMKRTPMFLGFKERMGGTKLLPANQVVIGDWESRDFGGDVFVAPKDDTLEKMYCEMGSVFLGTYVRRNISPTGHKAEYDLPFNHNQVLRRVKCFMDQRTGNGKTVDSFYDQSLTKNLRLRTCDSLTLTKTFTPPPGILADTVVVGSLETEPIQINAGFEFDEVDESYTLWMVRGSSESVDLCNDIAVAMCHVLLKTHGPSDVLLLASLFAVSDEDLEGYYYDSEMKAKLASSPNAKEVILDDMMSQPITLEGIKYFTFLSLPSDLSPPDTIPIELTQDSPASDAVGRFGKIQLSLLHWLEYACSQVQRIALNEQSSQDVGYRISRILIQFALVDDLSPQQWDRAAELMKDLQCIPTNKGFKSPVNTYFKEADVCGSLPVASLEHFLDIPVTPVADEGGIRFRSVTLEHIHEVLSRIRVCRITEWEDGLEHSLHELCSHADDLASHIIREDREHPAARGGFADIYRGLLHSNGASIRVAIKAVRIYSSGDLKKAQKQLDREIKVWRGLKHSNVLPFLGTTMGFNRFPAIVCPWVENGTLTCYLQVYHGRLLPFEILALLDDVASGVQYLHSQSVVHGDLSGSNVLIGKNGRAHLADFGLSILLTDLGGSTFAASSHIGGTLRWAAPELLNPLASGNEKEGPLKVRPTFHSDVYSLGCVMLQILTGKMPYHHLPYDRQVMWAICTGETPAWPNCDELTDRQRGFIQQCWSTVNPARSRPSSKQVLEFTKSEIAESNARFNW